MDVDDETPLDSPVPEPSEPTRRRRSRATTKAQPRMTKAQKRAESAKETLRELIRLRRPDLDIEGLGFLEVVDRDADAWGRFVAQLADWFAPFGQIVDLLFGAPLLTIIGLAPSIRAARRDLGKRRERNAAEREAERVAAEAVAPDYPPDNLGL